MLCHCRYCTKPFEYRPVSPIELDLLDWHINEVRHRLQPARDWTLPEFPTGERKTEKKSKQLTAAAPVKVVRTLTLNGETHTFLQWSRLLQERGLMTISDTALAHRKVDFGWSDEDCLTKPVRRKA